ncbi:2-oxoacid:ferredoxin oxidoreductase subunit beta [bacterium]|nr:2-oxoacid:ferredoxin oxidoreductase subunit beta [bacterium]
MRAVQNQRAVTISYLRTRKKFPTVWCPGCSLGTIMGALIRAIHKLGIEKDEVALVSGIGCTGRMPVYTDFNTLHGTHGRALPFATGIKLANPGLKVIAAMGDGDATAIGGNHFIHTCRRNLDLTAVIVNNYIYGMTGGQYSPTTPTGKRASTAPYGMIEPPFDICGLAKAAGASYVARTTSYHAVAMTNLFVRAIEKKGFSVVEIMSHCYTTYGRRNRYVDPVEMMAEEKKLAVPLKVYSKMREKDPDYELEPDQYLTGVFTDDDSRREYTEIYAELCKQVQEGQRAG